MESDSWLTDEGIESNWPTKQQVKLEAAMATLNDEQIRRLALKYREGYIFQEMAMIFDRSESAIKMRLYRTIESIKEKVSDNHGKE